MLRVVKVRLYQNKAQQQLIQKTLAHADLSIIYFLMQK